MNEMQRQKLRKAGKTAGYVPKHNADNDKNDEITPMQSEREATPVVPLYSNRETMSTMEAKKRR
jgi:hypothetical protein